MKKSKFRFSSVVLAPLAIATLVATASVAQALPPTAVSDFALTVQGTQNLSIPVLVNDTDPELGPLTISSVTQGSQGGSVTISQDGTTIIYTPVLTFSGEETFTYTVIDNESLVSNTATVTVSIAPPPSTFASAITGNGYLQGPRRLRQRPNITFQGYYSNNFTLGGQVLYKDPINRINFRSTEITAVQVFGNTGTIYGFGVLNGVPGVGFVLSTTDQFPSYITQGDTVSLALGTDLPILTSYSKGGSRVVGGGEIDGGGPFPVSR